jgi:hypothetical protein
MYSVIHTPSIVTHISDNIDTNAKGYVYVNKMKREVWEFGENKKAVLMTRRLETTSLEH